eukprot:3634371-Prorocentrum_lima.AAC.1
MTSSLVGSEMCIRDRWDGMGPTARFPLVQCFGRCCVVVQSSQVGLLAVSYTHLTLPTICSV